MWKIWAVAILPAFAVAAQDVLVYDNSTTLVGNTVLVFPNGQEVGDQIYLSNYVANPYLTGFSFEYFSPNTAFTYTYIACDVRFYLNDGPLTNGYSSPGTVFYDTGPFSIETPYSDFPGTNAEVLSFTNTDLYVDALTNLDPNMSVPATFTVAMKFTGLSGPDLVGLNDFEPATVGTNYGNFWYNSGGAWALLSFTNNPPIGFGMQFYATNQPAPEPGTLYLAITGAGLLAGFARRRRQ
jgi:hypothetical protein